MSDQFTDLVDADRIHQPPSLKLGEVVMVAETRPEEDAQVCQTKRLFEHRADLGDGLVEALLKGDQRVRAEGQTVGLPPSAELHLALHGVGGAQGVTVGAT